MRRVREKREVLTPKSFGELRELVADVRIRLSVDPTSARAAAGPLLEIVGLYSEAEKVGFAPAPEAELRDAALDALLTYQDASLVEWMAKDVLSSGGSVPIERRVGVIRLLRQKTQPLAKLALILAAHEADPRISLAAYRALSGWNDEAVDDLFLEELGRVVAGERAPTAPIAIEHFTQVRVQSGGRIHERFSKLVGDGLVSMRWRETSRAAALTRALDNASAVPFLLAALDVWKVRADSGAQSLRVRIEIARALEDRAGVALGLESGPWRTWWDAARTGTGGRPPIERGGVVDRTKAGFFGLKPMSDRVVFVLDRSGSMERGFAVRTEKDRVHDERRWDRAVSELLQFVEMLGPKARFDIVVFHDFAEEWRGDLVPADAKGRAAAAQWLAAQRPNGNTRLRAGVERAFRMQSNGTVELGRLEADTAILLCDGATDEGPSWVPDFLTRLNTDAMVRFYAVQIGRESDGALERLVKGTGGELVSVDG